MGQCLILVSTLFISSQHLLERNDRTDLNPEEKEFLVEDLVRYTQPYSCFLVARRLQSQMVSYFRCERSLLCGRLMSSGGESPRLWTKPEEVQFLPFSFQNFFNELCAHGLFWLQLSHCNYMSEFLPCEQVSWLYFRSAHSGAVVVEGGATLPSKS